MSACWLFPFSFQPYNSPGCPRRPGVPVPYALLQKEFAVRRSRVPTLVTIAAIILGSITASAALAWGLPGKKTEPALKQSAGAAPAPERPTLHGEISIEVKPDALKARLDELYAIALERNERLRGLDDSSQKYMSAPAKVWGFTKDTLNYIFEYRGHSQSSEAGDVILGEKPKAKSRASSEYLRQKESDATQLAVVSNVMQLASALGMADREAGEAQASEAFASLEQLVGSDEATKTVQTLAEYRNKVQVPESVYKRAPWSIQDRSRKVKFIMERCLETDPVIQDIKKEVYKYNHHGKLYLATSRIVKTSLGIASFSPTIAAPIAQIGQYAYTMATGGAEEDKLLKELYLDKRLESRSRLVNEKASLALENYQLARLTRNPVLLGCSESLLGQMTGPDGIEQVLGGSVLAAGRAARQAASAGAQTQPGLNSATGGSQSRSIAVSGSSAGN